MSASQDEDQNHVGFPPCIFLSFSSAVSSNSGTVSARLGRPEAAFLPYSPGMLIVLVWTTLWRAGLSWVCFLRVPV